MKKVLFPVALVVILLGYQVAGLTRAKFQSEIMDLARDINTVHAKLSVSAARRTYVTLHRLFYTEGANPDASDPIEREIARMDSSALAKAKPHFQSEVEEVDQLFLDQLSTVFDQNLSFGYFQDFEGLLEALEYASDEVLDKEFYREAFPEKMTLMIRSARLDVPAAVAYLDKPWSSDKGAILRALANPRYSFRAVPLLSAMADSKNDMKIDAAVPYLAKIHTSASARVLIRLLNHPIFRASAMNALVSNGSRQSKKVLLGFFKDRRSDSLARFALDGMYSESYTNEPGTGSSAALPSKKSLAKHQRFILPKLHSLWRRLDAADRKNLLHLVRTSSTDHYSVLLQMAQGIDPMRFQMAFDADDRNLVQKLLDSGANVNSIHGEFGPDMTRYAEGQWNSLPNLLTVACDRGNLPMVRLLLANEARIDGKLPPCNQCFSGDPPVVVALLRGHYDVVRFLAETGANLNASQFYFANGADGNDSKKSGPEEYRKRYGTVLKYAIWKGETELAKFLLEHGAKPNNFNKYNADYSNLILAAKRSDTDMVNALVRKGAEVDFIDEHGKSALMAAAAAGDLPMAELLIRHGAVLDSLNRKGQSALSFAAMGTRMEMLVLLAKMPTKNRTGIFNHAALAAAGGGSVEGLRFLLSQGAEADVRDRGGLTLMMSAAVSGNIPVLAYLADKKADREEKDGQGCRALHHAAAAGNVQAIDLLISRGFKIDSRSDSGKTPLMYAVEKDSLAAVKLLLARGADTRAANRDGHSILDLAHSVDMAILLGAGKPKGSGAVRSKNAGLVFQMREAIRKQDIATVNALAGILDLNPRSVPGIVEYTLATEAAATGNLGLLKKLVDNGADPKLYSETETEAGPFRYNPMIAALNSESPNRREMLDYLLERGVDLFSLLKSEIMHSDSLGFFRHSQRIDTLKSLVEDGKTLLMVACGHGRTWAVKELVRRGMDINAKGPQLGPDLTDEYAYPPAPETALNNAILGKYHGIAQFLLDHGAAPDSFSMVACAQADDFDRLRSFSKKGIKPAGPVLIEAVRAEHIRIAKWALENGIKVDTRDAEGRTPLIWAVKIGSVKAVRFLVKHRARKALKDKEGKDAMDYAHQSWNGNDEVIQALQ